MPDRAAAPAAAEGADAITLALDAALKAIRGAWYAEAERQIGTARRLVAARPAPAAAPREDVAVIRREAWETVLAELEQLAATVEGDPLALGRGAAETIRWAVECVRSGVTVKPWAELSDVAAREAARGEG